MRVRPLTEEHEQSVAELLREDPAQNLFLIGFLTKAALERGYWFGAIEGTKVVGATLILHDRLAVPYAPRSDVAQEIGRSLGQPPIPQMLVGPRDACDALWAAWSRHTRADRFYDQRLYVCSRAPEAPTPIGFRRATLDDAEIISEYAGQMEAEDLGRNPALDDPGLHRQVIRDRIRTGKTWVIEEHGELVFMINVGTSLPIGCQVGGTYVPPHRRGSGVATRGMMALNRILLQTHGMVTLHVNGSNLAAVKTYERSGFEFHAPFRLITAAKP